MSILRYDAKLSALLVTKGHPFARDAFFAMFEGDPEVVYTAVEQPAAQVFFAPEQARAWDAFVLYDMPGVDFTKGAPPRLVDPPARLRRDFEALVESGHGFVFLHHAIAAWPTWDAYAEWVGGRFLYAPGTVRGRAYPDSGYRFDVAHRLTPAHPAHPVLAGLESGFELTDELYLCPIFEEAVTPLLTSDADFSDAGFFSAANAVAGKRFSREGWSHPRGSNLVAWTHVKSRSPIVTILCGDGPQAYASPALRRLIANAVRFVAAEAKRLRA